MFNNLDPITNAIRRRLGISSSDERAAPAAPATPPDIGQGDPSGGLRRNVPPVRKVDEVVRLVEEKLDEGRVVRHFGKRTRRPGGWTDVQ